MTHNNIRIIVGQKKEKIINKEGKEIKFIVGGAFEGLGIFGLLEITGNISNFSGIDTDRLIWEIVFEITDIKKYESKYQTKINELIQKGEKIEIIYNAMRKDGPFCVLNNISNESSYLH